MSPIISVAPMMDRTDRHERYFLRLIAPNVRLYTEMITTQAIIHGHSQRLLMFDPMEHYLALQLGGSCPKELTFCAEVGREVGYNEINLNIGCPSKRVHNGRFGACLMLNPHLVAECIAAIESKVNLPISVKCRIGVDNHDSIDFLSNFIQIVSQAGCKFFIIHARKAWLTGLSPKQNREIPPLQYDLVKQIKQIFPHLIIIINGGIQSIEEIKKHLQYVDGVMIGRMAYANPYLLAEIESSFFSTNILSRFEIIQRFYPYVQQQLEKKVRLSSITRHILGLFQGQRGAAAWRRYLSEHAHRPHAGVEVIENALKFVGSS